MNAEKLDKTIEILQALRDGKRVMAEIEIDDLEWDETPFCDYCKKERR